MSWGDMVKNNLLGTGKINKAAILGLDGTVWGKSDNFNLSEEEAQTCARSFTITSEVLGTGLKLEGQKYFVLQADDERIIGKKESRGFFIYKTSQTVIIGMYGEGIQPEQCSKAVGALADYFRTTGY